MENQTVHKLLIGMACAGLGAGAHFFLSERATPEAPAQPTATTVRVRPQPVLEKELAKVRPTGAKFRPTDAKVRPEVIEGPFKAKRDRGRGPGKVKTKQALRAC